MMPSDSGCHSNDVLRHDAREGVCHNETDIETKLQTSHLGTIWFPHSSHGLVH
jgi:hypothetical protein